MVSKKPRVLFPDTSSPVLVVITVASLDCAADIEVNAVSSTVRISSRRAFHGRIL